MTAFLTTGIGSMPRRSWLFTTRLAWTESTTIMERRDLDAPRETFVCGARRCNYYCNQSPRKGWVGHHYRRGTETKNYVTYLTSNMNGFDYEELKPKEMAEGAGHLAGRCVGPITHQNSLIVKDLEFTLSKTEKPVKITLPGPMTVVDSTVDEFYGNEREMAFAWASAINKEAKLLDKLKPEVIQFDEPRFSRLPGKVEEWGIDALNACVEGIQCKTAVHVCYGYPQPGLSRPINDSYETIIGLLEKSNIDQLALEFAGANLARAI